MAAEMLAGPAIQLAFDLFLGSVKGTIQKAGMFKDTLKKIQEKLEALSPLIKQMKEYNIVLGLPDSELESFTKAMKEGKKLVDECSKIKNWKVLDKSRHTTKLNDTCKSLDELFKILQVQQARDGKVSQILIKDIHDSVQRIEKATSVCVGGTSSSTTRAQVEGKSMKIPPPAFTVGLDAPLECLKKKILEGDRSVHVLTAPGGFGKTTLAKKLCWDDQIIEKFSTNILFVKVSKTPNLIRIVQNLYKDKKDKGQDVPTLLDEEDAIDHLEQLLPDLGKSPILLVLDDVWSGSEYLIEKFNLQIPDYKVLVTSRFEFPGFAPRYNLEILNDEDAITLFCNHAFPKNGSSNNIPDDLVNEVAVEHCKKVPLALELIGISLRNKPREIWQREVRKWSERTSSVLSYEAKLLRCLQSSVDILEEKDPNLKECFMDLGSFPEDQKIPAAALIDLWTELHELEESDAVAYLLDLTYHSLANLEDTRNYKDELDKDYNKIFVTQHDMLRELSIHQSAQDIERQGRRLIVDLSGGNLPKWWKKKNEQLFNARLVSITTDRLFSGEYCCDMQLPETEALVLNFPMSEHDLPESVKSMSKLKVLIAEKREHCVSVLNNFKILGSLTNLKMIRLESIEIPSLGETHIKFENLQKLYLVSCEIDQNINLSEVFPNLVEINIEDCISMALPDTLFSLINLTKMSITYLFFQFSLPEEIGNLVNLEVLRIMDCVHLEGLPDSICKLSKLTFLEISNCRKFQNLPENIGQLRSLRKLNMFSCYALKELPPSVSDLEQLEDVVCDERLKEQWVSYLPNHNVNVRS